MVSGEMEHRPGYEAILDPGEYNLVANNIPPDIKSTQFHYFRETDSHGTVSVDEYLDAISLFTDAGDDSIAPLLRGVFSVHEYYSDRRIIGLEPGEQEFVSPAGISIKGSKEQPKSFARQHQSNEQLIRPQVKQIGGEIEERYNRILRENRRILPPMYVFEDLPDLYQSTGLTRKSYVGLLTTLLDDSDLRSAISDAQSGAGPSTGVSASWYLKPAHLIDETTAEVPVGLKFTVDDTEIPGVDRSTIVYSPMVSVRTTRTNASSPVWETKSGVVAEVLQRIRSEITGEA